MYCFSRLSLHERSMFISQSDIGICLTETESLPLSRTLGKHDPHTVDGRNPAPPFRKQPVQVHSPCPLALRPQQIPTDKNWQTTAAPSCLNPLLLATAEVNTWKQHGKPTATLTHMLSMLAPRPKKTRASHSTAEKNYCKGNRSTCHAVLRPRQNGRDNLAETNESE